MKKLIIYLIMVVTCFTLQGQDKTLPNIIIKDLDGNNVNIQDIENDSNPIILNFWATWCKPCKNELNNIDDLYQEWKDETNVKIIIVSVDDSRSSAKVKPYINSMGWTFEGLSDPNRQLARQLNVITVPHTFLINGEGKIVYEHKGYITGDEDELYEQLKLIQ